MIFFRLFIVFVFLEFGQVIIVNAQQKKVANMGSVKGVVRDTTLNYVIKSATVSIYRISDSALVSYQITDIYGQFKVANLPVETPLKLLISNIGYESFSKRFIIFSNENVFNFNEIFLKSIETNLKEVNITVPPISMNGDTLEFNASAFKLDSNAVVEDLLRKIPNITLWGDGTITVNGRSVKSLLVNGREFFGGDTKIAIQNLAKNTVEKVQVYKVGNNINPLDSTVEMNIKLKKSKNLGYFGKLGAGYGTNNRNEADGSINAFSTRVQFSVVGASNNINKIANDVRTLTANSTFKGVGTRIEYRPDFRIGGITKTKALGSNFNYSFIEKPTHDRKSTLSLNFFMQTRDNDNSSISEITTATVVNEKIFETNSDDRASYNSDRIFDSKYEWKKKTHSLNIIQSFKRGNYQNVNVSVRNSLDNEKLPVSTNYSRNTMSGVGTNFYFNINYIISENFARFSQRFKGININYSLNIDDEIDDQLNQTNFKSLTTPLSSRSFNRKYEAKHSSTNQQLNIEFRKLKQLLFGNLYFLGIDFSIGNEVNLKNRNNSSLIGDFNNSTATYDNNDYLSNQTQVNRIEETPNLMLSKSISKSLSNRFSKSLNITGSLKQKIIYEENSSAKSFQNIRRYYNRLVTSGNISYTNNQYGEFNRNYSISYNTSIQTPTLQQLAPLIDSTNIYYIQKGNLNLKESVTTTISFNFKHEDETNKNPLNYNLNISGAKVKNAIADSVLISSDNRRTIYYTNSPGGIYFNLDGGIRKALKLKTSEVQISLNSSFNISQSPNYINNVFTLSKSLNMSNNLKLNFTYSDYLSLEGIQSYSTYISAQQTLKTTYRGANVATTLSSSYNVTQKLTVNSNVTFNSSNATNSEAINFAIWNSGLAYRFLNGKNLEIKLTALDLLRQNKSIINYGTFNSFIIGRQNVLQYYFMTTISYYPRRFWGKPQKNK